MAFENRILSKMLERLFAALVNGPSLNCRPHSSRQRVDWTLLGKLKDQSPEDALRPCLLMLRARLALLGRSEALLVLHSRRGNRLALSGEATATATALARRSLGMTAGTTAAAATTDLIGLAVVSAMTAVRPRIRRGCDRQRGDAGCEKDPGHHNFSFERQQRPVRHTVPTVKRMEPAFYRTSVNLKLLDCSDS